MKLDIKRGIEIAIIKSGLSHKQFRDKLGINNNMTFWNRRNRDTLTLKQAVEIADVAGISIYELIDDMKSTNQIQP